MSINKKLLITENRASYSIYLRIKDCIDVIERRVNDLSESWYLLNNYLYVLEDEFGLTEEELDNPLGDLANNEGSRKLLELIRKKLNVEEVK